MKKITLFLLLFAALSSCKKDELKHPSAPPVKDPPPTDQQPGNPGNTPLFIKLRAVLKIGDISYDSIPARLTLEAWDANGSSVTTYHSLVAGNNQLQLPQGKTRYRLIISKWGGTGELILSASEIVADSVYRIVQNKEPKKLRNEYVYVLRNGKYEAESRTEYFFNATNNLDRIVYYRKRPDGQPYVDMVSRFRYSGGKPEAIDNYNGQEQLSTSTLFYYDGQGRINSMRRTGENEAIATVEYDDHTREIIFIRYSYPGKSYTMSYTMQLAEGNLVESNAVTSHHNSEHGTYQYDLNINPYIHLGWPDFLFTHCSRNNVVAESQRFYGSYPAAVPSGYTYTYDNEGYPKELVKTYKSVLTGQYLYTTKTVFVY